MISSIESQLAADVERINRIPIVSTMLDVVCQVTGMGFAVVALVTPERWIACRITYSLG